MNTGTITPVTLDERTFNDYRANVVNDFNRISQATIFLLSRKDCIKSKVMQLVHKQVKTLNLRTFLVKSCQSRRQKR